MVIEKTHGNALPEVFVADHPEWVALYEEAWRMAKRNVEVPAISGWLPQMTCMPGMGKLWQWDSCFMMFMARYGQGVVPLLNNLDNLYRQQREDGFISMAYVIASGQPAFGERINPPLFAWAEWSCSQVTGDTSRFKRVLPILSRYYMWIRDNRRRDNGLYWFEDSGSSGMDNAPRSGYFAQHLDGSDICHIDLICQQALSAESLQHIAAACGDKNAEAFFRSEVNELKQLVDQHHWHDKSGFYYDLFNRNLKSKRCNYVNHKTAASFWPLVSGLASTRQCERLLEHLLDPNEFNTLHPVPTLAKSDPNYHELGRYWLGSVWAPTNYMITCGLRRYGYHEIARDIAIRHLQAMCQVWENPAYGSIWECYAPDVMAPAINDEGETVRSDFVGWSGLGPVSMLIESILGFHFDAATNTIHWRIAHHAAHGIRRLAFNGRIVDLIASEPDGAGKRRITINLSDSLNLMISMAGRSADTGRQLALPAGCSSLTI